MAFVKMHIAFLRQMALSVLILRFYSGRYRFISNFFFSKLSFYVVLDCYKTVFRLNLVNDEFKLCCVTISCIFQFPYLFTNYAAICLAIYISVYLYIRWRLVD